MPVAPGIYLWAGGKLALERGDAEKEEWRERIKLSPQWPAEPLDQLYLKFGLKPTPALDSK